MVSTHTHTHTHTDFYKTALLIWIESIQIRLIYKKLTEFCHFVFKITHWSIEFKHLKKNTLICVHTELPALLSQNTLVLLILQSILPSSNSFSLLPFQNHSFLQRKWKVFTDPSLWWFVSDWRSSTKFLAIFLFGDILCTFECMCSFSTC